MGCAIARSALCDDVWWQTSLETQISELEERCGSRQQKLGGSKKFHEFMREADDFEQWIGEQMQTALSDDYGQDYEHLQVLTISSTVCLELAATDSSHQWFAVF